MLNCSHQLSHMVVNCSEKVLTLEQAGIPDQSNAHSSVELGRHWKRGLVPPNRKPCFSAASAFTTVADGGMF